MVGLFVLLLLAALVPSAIYFFRWYHASPFAPSTSRLWRSAWLWAAIGGGLDLILLVLALAAPVSVESEWFEHLGLGPVYSKRLTTELILFVSYAAIAAVVLRFALWVPFRALPGDVTVPTSWKRPYRGLKVGRYVVLVAGALAAGAYATTGWQQALLYAHGVPTGEVDPIFGRDVGYYLFQWPFYTWAVAAMPPILVWSLILTGLVAWPLAVMVQARYGKPEVMDFAGRTLRYCAPVFSALFVVMAVQTYLGRYGLLCPAKGRTQGVAFVDDYITIPARWGYIVIYLALAAGIGWVSWRPGSRPAWRVALVSGLALVLWGLFGSGAVPWSVQVWVRSNELVKEQPYIEHAIAATRKAFAIDDVKDHEFHPNTKLTYEDIKKGPVSLDNVRLWDWSALEATYQETQGIRPYYRFPDIDIDRYTVNGRVRQVMLGSREIDLSKLPVESQTWNNQHLVYTHGYGVCMNEAAEFTPDGMPRMHISNIPPASDVPELKIVRPEIYFGELTTNHIYVQTKAEEFSYPGDNGNVFHRYEGTAGAPVGSGLRRLAFAWCFDGLQQLFSQYITAESKLIWHREIHERIRTIAPFLRLDSDSYKVVRDNGRLCYIQDAYTWSNTYPYSAPYQGQLNYIRGSVKITIDAYDGDPTFWVFDDKDPVLQAWMQSFPGLFHPRSEMPPDLLRHVRYPEDLFGIQARMLADYHMNARDFYMREDRWQIARDLFKQGPQEVDPYYALLKLPEETSEEFVLMLPLTPFERHNLVAWLGGRCDGANYGHLVVYRMPHQSLVWGPMQIDTKIDQDPEMSAALTLWKQKGSDVIRGTLLVVPLQDGLLYVEPIYLKADKVGMPQLRKVVVGYGDRVAWDTTIDLALQRLFGKSPSSPAGPAPPLGAEAPASQLKAVAAALDHYFELMGQGRAAEAGKVLEDLRKSVKGEQK
jgi:uncharacterized membrane protein (UPF0182 family)